MATVAEAIGELWADDQAVRTVADWSIGALTDLVGVVTTANG
ncbi:hypothetical protein [Streptomyces sp. NPDC049879]